MGCGEEDVSGERRPVSATNAANARPCAIELELISELTDDIFACLPPPSPPPPPASTSLPLPLALPLSFSFSFSCEARGWDGAWKPTASMGLDM